MSAVVELEHASVRLGARMVVARVSLTLKSGECLALLGPNGAGKTSILRACVGQIALAGGTARLAGADPRALSTLARARCAAYLPQRPQAVWPVSVEGLVALGRFAYGAAPHRLREADQRAVDRALAAAHLGALRKRRMDELSGGEKARAHLARALAQEAQLLVLDEPTAGLDPAQALGVADIITAHARAGGACLFATHDIAFALRAARVVLLLRDGQTLGHGAPDSVLTPQALEAAYGRKGALSRVGDAFTAVFE